MTTTTRERFEEKFKDVTHFGCPSTPQMPCATLREDLLSFIESECQRREEVRTQLCREIFMEEVNWAEWGMDGAEAGKDFDEHLAKLTNQSITKI